MASEQPKKKVGYGPNLVLADRSQPTPTAPSPTPTAAAATVVPSEMKYSTSAAGGASSSSSSSDMNASLAASERVSSIPSDTPQVRGPDFNQGVTLDTLFAGFRYMGLQATNLALAVEEVNRMVSVPY
jgi:hypothetical protein